jgi:trehalose 6-phosphate phosphatase
MNDLAPAPSHEWCLFLDVDGTLLEISDTPSGVFVDAGLKELLLRVAKRLDGAVALVSGRSIGVLDQLFPQMEFPAAGLHGVERRSASGAMRGANYSDTHLNAARAQLAAFVEMHPGTLLEDKGRSIAVHFRLAPAFESHARRAADAAAGSLGTDYHVQEGKMVFELKPRGYNKGTAAEEFMQEPPFAGRIPVFVGDDLTDEVGFRVVEALGGISVAVGGRVGAQWRLRDPAAVRRWLESIASLD